MQTTPPSEYWDVEPTAKFLGVGAQTLAVWRSTGRHALPFVKVGRRVRYRVADLQAWLERRTATHTGSLEGK